MVVAYFRRARAALGMNVCVLVMCVAYVQRDASACLRTVRCSFVVRMCLPGLIWRGVNFEGRRAQGSPPPQTFSWREIPEGLVTVLSQCVRLSVYLRQLGIVSWWVIDRGKRLPDSL